MASAGWRKLTSLCCSRLRRSAARSTLYRLNGCHALCSSAAYVIEQSGYIEKMLSHDPDERPSVNDVLYGELFRSKDQVPVLPFGRGIIIANPQVYQYTQRAHVKLDTLILMRPLPADNRGPKAVT